MLRLTETMTLARYALILGGVDAFLRAWEPRIHAALPQRLQAWFRMRRRGGFASADVEWLRSVAGVAPQPMSAALAVALPLGDLADVLGSMYVIEAYALDGRAITPHLKSTLGLGQGRGASYFHGFGGETGVMWNNFRVLASLEIGESSRVTVQACKSAKRTFAALIDLFAALAPAVAAVPVHVPVVQKIAPALLAAFAGDADATRPAPLDDDDDATRPAPLDDTHVDLPVDDWPARGDTLIELPLDDAFGEAGDRLDWRR